MGDFTRKMRRKFLLLSTTALLVVSLCGCSLRPENDDKNTKDNEVIEDVIEDKDDEKENKTINKENKKDDKVYGDEPSKLDEHENKASDWTQYNQVDNVVYIKYTNGIADDYMITDKGSFGDMCTWIEYAIPGYPSETYRKVFSLFFASQELFEEDLTKMDADTRNLYFAILASISWQIDHDGATVKDMHCIVGDDTLYSYEVTAPGTGDYIFQWNINTNELKIGKDDNNLVSYETTVFDSNYIAAYMVAIDEALLGNKVEDIMAANFDDEVIETTINDSDTDLVNALSTLKGAKGYENEIINAIETFYNSSIESYEIEEADSEYENIVITMANGSTCKYFSSSVGTSVYDTTSTFETIWNHFEN